MLGSLDPRGPGPATEGVGLPAADGSGDAARGPVGRAGRVRVARRALHGVLLLDKPEGLSSNDALQKARWLMRAEKAGHTGTLDPLATGLLPLCFGAATKFSQVSLEAHKRYTATLRLGLCTTTGDREGAPVRERPLPALDDAALAAVLQRFVGEIEQVPPMHSALKKDGRALYEYARAGEVVERQARRITVHALNVLQRSADRLVLDVRCSKGTYVRTLAEDIGEALGCGAHLAALRRTGSGPLVLDRAIGLDALAALDPQARDAWLLPVDRLVADWPACALDEGEAGRFLTGLRRRVSAPDQPAVRVYGPALPAAAGAAPGAGGPGLFLGTGRIVAGELIPVRLLSPLELGAGAAEAVAPQAAAPARA